MSDALKREAAARAVAEITSGMKVGLGTGSTARHFVELLGDRVAQGLDIVGVPTSEATAKQARECGIPLSDLDALERLDVTVDGADEIDPALNLIKGGGGALLREKIVAAASDAMIVIADSSKIVEALGRFPLPIEVNRFGLGATRHAIARAMRHHHALGELQLRTTESGEAFFTDGGHLILDAFFGRISQPEALSTELLDIPGVVQHGLFLKMCRKAYVATPNGVETLLESN
ncbi:ribose-5-phosphate isomerase RpiA [Devosia sp. Naph2]|uniref:ribose-5-phosphate isomerase RpiA n=1 Tax=Devosia polycyclovorans TaxID=3345148 RepID=UPI0035D0638F